MNFYVHQTVDVYSINEATDTKMSKTVKVGQYINIRLFTTDVNIVSIFQLNSVRSYYWINPQNVLNGNILKLTNQEAKYFKSDNFRGDHFISEKQKSGDMYVNSGYD